MSIISKTTVAAAVVSCVLSFISIAQARISPDIRNLLIVASEKNDGKDLDMVAELAITADPAAKQDIQKLVVNLKQDKAEKSGTPRPRYFSFDGWSGDVELNFLRSSGNTSQESLGLAGKLHRDAGNYHHTLEGFYDLNRNMGVKDKQRWGLGYKLDYDVSEKFYLTSFAGYENDQFGPFRERITSSLGLGYQVFNTESYGLKIEGGPSILFTKDLPGDKYDTSYNSFASSIFDWAINNRSELTNTTIFYYGDKNIIESKTDLKVKINGSLSSKFSYDILYDQDAPLNRNKTDTVARAGLQYDF